MRRRLSFLALALAAAVLLAAGCGGSSGGGSAGSTGSGSAGSGGGGSPSPARRSNWPLFGRVPERTHYLPAESRILDPPLREAWSVSTHALIEFPPAIHGGVAYLVNKYGNGKAVRLRDHKVLWEVTDDPSNKGKPTFVTAPVYYRGKVFGAFLDGYLVAADAATGKKVWQTNLHAHLESSPLAVDGRLYLGTDASDLVALRTADGKVVWKFNSPGAIKASPSYHEDRVFLADYESSAYGLDARTGKLIWRTNTSQVPPYGEGGFFSSPAVAFGRVYAARDDGTVYAFDERTGKVAWAFQAGAAIYGSPAVARVPGTLPTVYIGAENGRLYALDARTGKPRWHFDVGGPIPGTATVIGHTVYTSSFTTRKTLGVDARSHRQTFALKQAGYTPVISDGRRLFVVGYYALIGLQPTRP